MVKFLPTKNLPPTNNIMEQLVLLKDRRIIMAVSAMILSGSSAIVSILIYPQFY